MMFLSKTYHPHRRVTAYLLVCLALFFMFPALHSCQPGVPKDYIQPGKMEDILYDYHLAQGILDSQYQGKADSVYYKAYKLAVMKKYGVTEADFDKSLQYYMRHTERLHKMYEHLAERFENEALKQGASVNDLNNFGALTAKGDTADIWSGERAAILVPDAPFNKISFAFKADSAFHKGDRFTLSFNTQFIVQEGGRDAVAVLTVVFNNDSISTQSRHISNNMSQSLQISDTERQGIKELKGFLLFNRGYSTTETTLKLLSLTNIKLIRMHTSETNEASLPTTAGQTPPTISGTGSPGPISSESPLRSPVSPPTPQDGSAAVKASETSVPVRKLQSP